MPDTPLKSLTNCRSVLARKCRRFARVTSSSARRVIPNRIAEIRECVVLDIAVSARGMLLRLV